MDAFYKKLIAFSCLILAVAMIYRISHNWETKPPMTTAEVSAWATTAIETINTYSYENYQNSLQNSQQYFTAIGWEQYLNALQASNNIETVNTKKMKVVTKAVDLPTVLSQGLSNDIYHWTLAIPIKSSYQMPPYDGSTNYEVNMFAKLIIQYNNNKLSIDSLTLGVR